MSNAERKKSNVPLTAVNFCLIIAAGFLSACLNDGASRKLESAASAEQREDGSVAVREPNQAESLRIDELHDQMLQIDRNYPTPPIPIIEPSTFRVSHVSENAILTLVDGREVTLDGISCLSAEVANLRNLLTLAGAKVAFMNEPKTSLNPIPANLWLVEHIVIDGRTDKTYLRIAEAAISSGWCRPSPTSTSIYDARYAAIAALADRRKKARR